MHTHKHRHARTLRNSHFFISSQTVYTSRMRNAHPHLHCLLSLGLESPLCDISKGTTSFVSTPPARGSFALWDLFTPFYTPVFQTCGSCLKKIKYVFAQYHYYIFKYVNMLFSGDACHSLFVCFNNSYKNAV